LCNRKADAKGNRRQVAEFRMDLESSVANCQKCRRECRGVTKVTTLLWDLCRTS
jgi:hypothetical protein